MFESGIVELRDIHRPNTALGRQKMFAYSLLRTSMPPAQDEVQAFETVIKEVRLSSGVYRTTSRGRFSELDPVVTEILVDTFPREQCLVAHDWAISDGLAAMEWAEHVLRKFPSAQFVASDFILHLIEASSDKETYILEPDGTPLQYIRPPFVLPLSYAECPVYFVNRLMKLWASRRVEFVGSVARSLDSKVNAGSVVQEPSGWAFRTISLLHPEAAAFAANHPQVEFRVHDVFTKPASQYDVLRTMNIFNRCYFSEDTLQTGIEAALSGLRHGGLWIVGRTIDEKPARHDVTIFRKERSGVVAVYKKGSGSEIEDLVLEHCN